MKGTLCCIFNYAPLYRQAVYQKMDSAFDVQFCFGDEPIYGQGTQGIAQMDTTTLRRPVRKIRNRMLFGKHPWRSGILGLPFSREYSTFLITGDLNWAYIPFLLLCRLFGKRVYGWGHGVRTLKGQTLFKRWFHSNLDGYFIYGEKGRERMGKLGFNTDKIHVIYNSLVDRVLPEQNRSLESDIYWGRFGNFSPVLLFSGRLTAAKRVDMLLPLLKSMRGNIVIIGDGPEYANLKKLVLEIGIGGRVWFCGECYNEKKLAELFYNASLCVSPGNVGLLAIHAMQYGLPVVSHCNFETQMPEYEAIVEGKSGALFKEGDGDDLCRVVKNWLDERCAVIPFKHPSKETRERYENDGARFREEARNECYKIIAEHWTADEQLKILKSVLD